MKVLVVVRSGGWSRGGPRLSASKANARLGDSLAALFVKSIHIELVPHWFQLIFCLCPSGMHDISQVRMEQLHPTGNQIMSPRESAGPRKGRRGLGRVPGSECDTLEALWVLTDAYSNDSPLF